MDLIGVTSLSSVDQPLQLKLEVSKHPRVEQLTKLLGTEEVTQHLSVETQRSGPPLGQWCVALVHVDRDPAEQ